MIKLDKTVVQAFKRNGILVNKYKKANKTSTASVVATVISLSTKLCIYITLSSSQSIYLPFVYYAIKASGIDVCYSFKLAHHMDNFEIISPVSGSSPVILSIPHCGTQFPDDIVAEYKTALLPPDDTDWFVDQLYSFATNMGITIIKARYSRWVIDLNRNPDGQSLYNDGRLLTALRPATNFLGQPIYNDERQAVAPEEVQRRKALYFEPYHNKIQELIDEAKANFGKALLWDCHSIRCVVPSVYAQPFPDLILGSADGTSAAVNMIDKALALLSDSHYSFSHNHPFKGGYITRCFGKPAIHQHALQLEMVKTLYMDDSERLYDKERASEMQQLLKHTLYNLHQLLLQADA